MKIIPVLKVEVLNYESSNTTLSGTGVSNITINNHGRNVGDFILNSTLSATSQGSSERGSRKVTSIVDTNNFLVSQIVGQTSGQNIYFFKWDDITDYIQVNTFRLNLKTQGEATSSFNIIQTYTPGSGFDVELLEGKLVRIYFDNTLISTQFIDRISKGEITPKSNTFILSVSMRDLKSLTSRRIVSIDYDEGDYISVSIGASIVADVIDILKDEGIERGSLINSTLLLGKDWKNGAISIRQVLDECATKTGCQWYVNKDLEIDFLDEPSTIPNAPYDITDLSSFKDYTELTTDGELSNYVNKVICIGNDDGYGNQINFSKSNLSDQKLIQKINWGSGVYGIVLQNPNDNEILEYSSGVGTSPTNLNITNHPFGIGDFVYNVDREQGTYVTAIVDTSNVTVESITGQVPGDLILYFIGAKNAVDEILKKSQTSFASSPVPRILNFKTFETIEFLPGQKLKFNLAKFGTSFDIYFCIESVTIYNHSNKETFGQTVTAIQRDTADFSTHKRRDGADFFKSNF